MYLDYLFNFFIGSCLASHATVIYDRYQTQNFISGRSQCDACGSTLSLLDELPVVSYLLLRGKCRWCKQTIPIKLFIIEVIGGLSFLNISLFNSTQWHHFIFIYFLLIIAIFDFYDQEFPTILLCPLFLACLCKKFTFSEIDLIEFVPISMVLAIQSLKGKIGFGDLLIYLAISLFFSPNFANITFLIASLLFILKYILIKKKQKQAFIPYIYVAVILCKLWI